MDAFLIAQLSVLLLLIWLSSYFSSAETALTTVNRIRIQTLADENNRRAKTVLAITDARAKMLSTILICNNIVNISATALTTLIAIRLFGNAAVGAATAVLTMLIILFGEITPKNTAQVKAEDVSLRCAGVIRLLMTVLTPVIYVVDRLSRGILILKGINPDERPVMTENELRAIVDVSEEDGVIEDDERNMINNVVDLQDTYAREIMIPRIDLTLIPVTMNYDDLILFFREHRFTRLPVYENEPENIVGILNMKDLLLISREEFSVEKVMREPFFTYEMKNISDLLDEMRLGSYSNVIVLDEYGNASGMITMEDVLEEIVGEINDEYSGRDLEEFTEIIPGEEYTCLGSMDLDDLGEAIGMELTSDDYDTVGGYIIEHSNDKLPKVGEFITLPNGTKMIVEAVRRGRIMRVHIYMPKQEQEESTD
ncbi:MAG: HlyC/CorC family transporter [Lachnospiraceae bacterium]|nr:HlyC/CorC family transporter [Lachnospiraceae bacterium]